MAKPCDLRQVTAQQAPGSSSGPNASSNEKKSSPQPFHLTRNEQTFISSCASRQALYPALGPNREPDYRGSVSSESLQSDVSTKQPGETITHIITDWATKAQAHSRSQKKTAGPEEREREHGQGRAGPRGTRETFRLNPKSNWDATGGCSDGD